MDNQEFDLIAIGDIVTDAYIRITQANVYYDTECQCEKICLTNGAKIPYEFAKVVAGAGNAPNAAVSATRLGLNTALVTNLGKDDNGEEILEALEKNGIDKRFVKIHDDKMSNYHYVLWHKTRRTILIKHQAYDYMLPDIGSPKWIYMSSVGEDTIDYQKHVADYIQEHNIKLAFQPGTFQVKLGYEKLKFLYETAEVFFCNKEEAQLILQTEEDNPAQLAREMVAKGPKMAVITDGPDGAYMYDGENTWHIEALPNTQVKESTGAGDSFSSAFTSAVALGHSPEDALMWGAFNSASVVEHIGSQKGLLTKEEIEKRIAEKPEGYGPKKIDS